MNDVAPERAVQAVAEEDLVWNVAFLPRAEHIKVDKLKPRLYCPQCGVSSGAGADSRSERGGHLLDEHEGQFRKRKRLSRLHGGHRMALTWNKRRKGDILIW